MTGYERQPAAYERKYLPACSETQGCFNRDMINNPALKIGFKNNYRRRMGEVQFLNENHFNYRAQRTWKDLCWWDKCRDKATIKCCWEKKLSEKTDGTHIYIYISLHPAAAARSTLQEAEAHCVRAGLIVCRDLFKSNCC